MMVIDTDFFIMPATKVPIPNAQNVIMDFNAADIQRDSTESANSSLISPQYLSAIMINAPQQIYPITMENITSNVIRSNFAAISFFRFMGYENITKIVLCVYSFMMYEETRTENKGI